MNNTLLLANTCSSFILELLGIRSCRIEVQNVLSQIQIMNTKPHHTVAKKLH